MLDAHYVHYCQVYWLAVLCHAILLSTSVPRLLLPAHLHRPDQRQPRARLPCFRSQGARSGAHKRRASGDSI